jgi:hypothetical protein
MATSLVNTGVQFPDNSIQTTAATAGIPSGTVMLFAQTAAPTGFTKNTSTGNNTALRLVTGTAGTGGSVAFTTAFASQTPSGSVSVSGSVGNHTMTTTQLASHNHTFTKGGDEGGAQGAANGQSQPNTQFATSSTGGNSAHNHSLTISSATFSGSAINLAVSYVDVIRATKD